MTKVVLVAAVLATLTTSFAFGTEKKRFGDEIDPKTPVVKLAEVTARPAEYDKRTLVIEGRYAGPCGDGDYFFADGDEVVEFVFPTEEIRSIKRGTPIHLLGTVRVRRNANGDAFVRIEGRGLEVRE